MEFEEDSSFKPDAVFTNSRPKWVEDNKAHNCSKCNVGFTLLNRKHHCRRCGLVFCQKCSSNTAKIPQLNYNYVPSFSHPECKGSVDIFASLPNIKGGPHALKHPFMLHMQSSRLPPSSYTHACIH
ncbi:hypothetical protein SAMD00019534_018350 [Acytostelium subglobosum LB1]|uniref:hypothetical protein n=1 Tax=Acytostelium subglobosum LB1 TaxID=1410327 RepID=UPI000644CEBA|nr:hypothetical protein SAMD00019534_018350 [Acytostelium subglobosum LB1]GAM18660.1 hypothetical protein SAMD00019534_018350 [Acytostelium subglobosum LB1]|eukprot:XP_012757880.1 hypothetical protein SAMD00019534_018350 [Acytostelium subglobosum LB1]